MVSLVEWKEALSNANYSKNYTKNLIAKIPLIFNKSVYKNNELLDVICDNYDIINKDETAIKMVRHILNYCEKKEILTTDQLIQCRKMIKTYKSGVDNYVPTDPEIKQTLSQLTLNNRLVYIMYLVSGIRKVEGNYLLANIHKLKAQQYGNFVKITTNYLRHNKNSYFCYLHLEIYIKIKIKTTREIIPPIQSGKTVKNCCQRE